MVIQRSCSSFRVSVNRVSPALAPAMIPALDTRESVRVDFPWSTWAMTDMFRMFFFLSIIPRISSTVKFTWKRKQTNLHPPNPQKHTRSVQFPTKPQQYKLYKRYFAYFKRDLIMACRYLFIWGYVERKKNLCTICCKIKINIGVTSICQRYTNEISWTKRKQNIVKRPFFSWN